MPVACFYDAMLIVSRDANIRKTEKDLQAKMSVVMKWCNYHKLTINWDETNLMLISSKDPEVCTWCTNRWCCALVLRLHV